MSPKQLPENSISTTSLNKAARPWWILACGLGFIGVLLLVYRPILPGNFLMDDRRLVQMDNPLVTGEFSPSNVWFQTDFVLSDFAFWAQWRAWGANPGPYHTVNIILHAINAVLLWQVLRRIGVPGAWLAGAIFAVHPVCVNSVARIAEMKNTLSLTFFLLSLLFYFKKSATRDAVDPKYYFLSLIAFILALMAKTSTIMLPVVLLIGIAWRNRRITREDAFRAIPFFILSLGFGLMSMWFQKHQAMVGATLEPETFSQRLAQAGQIFWFYLSKALWPGNLNLIYPQWNVSAGLLNGYFADLTFVVTLVVCWRFRKSWGRPVLFGLGVYAILLFPALGFLNSQFLTKWRVSDHLQYLPIMAPIALVAGSLASVLPKIVFKGLGTAMVLILALLTAHRATAFASEESLFHDTLAKNPAAWGAHNDWGVILASRRNYGAAETEFRQALKDKPDYADAESNLGEVLLSQGKTGEAGSLFLAALSTKPDDAATQLRYAMLLAKLGQTRQAAYHQRMAIEFAAHPENKTRVDYATMLHQLGDFGGAEEQYRKVLELDPSSVEALNNLAWMLATAPEAKFRSGAEAVKLAERAGKFPSPKGMCVPGTLAAAYAEAGRYSDAVSTAQKAIDDEMEHDEMRFARINSQLLNYYQSGKPFHEPKAKAPDE